MKAKNIFRRNRPLSKQLKVNGGLCRPRENVTEYGVFDNKYVGREKVVAVIYPMAFLFKAMHIVSKFENLYAEKANTSGALHRTPN